MSAGLVVELERLAAEAALCRAQLEELGHLLASCRQRIGDGVAAPTQASNGVATSPVAVEAPTPIAPAAIEATAPPSPTTVPPALAPSGSEGGGQPTEEA